MSFLDNLDLMYEGALRRYGALPEEAFPVPGQQTEIRQHLEIAKHALETMRCNPEIYDMKSRLAKLTSQQLHDAGLFLTIAEQYAGSRGIEIKIGD